MERKHLLLRPQLDNVIHMHNGGALYQLKGNCISDCKADITETVNNPRTAPELIFTKELHKSDVYSIPQIHKTNLKKHKMVPLLSLIDYLKM